jgi:predicted glutamine amidotransferase
MFGYVGTSWDDVVMLFEALKRSAYEDPLAPNQTRNQHRNGWGYAFHSDGKTQHVRRTDPIFGEQGMPLPEFSGMAYAIFHAREASSKKLTGDPKFQHPFRGDWEEGTIFLAHNGAIMRDMLAPELMPRIDTKGIVDSEVGLRYLIQQRNDGVKLRESTELLQGFTVPNRALNLLVLEVPKKGSPQLFVKQFYNRDPDDREDRTEYYQMNYQRLNSGGVAVFSSSLSRVEQDFERAQILEKSELTSVSDLN